MNTSPPLQLEQEVQVYVAGIERGKKEQASDHKKELASLEVERQRKKDDALRIIDLKFDKKEAEMAAAQQVQFAEIEEKDLKLKQSIFASLFGGGVEITDCPMAQVFEGFLDHQSPENVQLLHKATSARIGRRADMSTMSNLPEIPGALGEELGRVKSVDCGQSEEPHVQSAESSTPRTEWTADSVISRAGSQPGEIRDPTDKNSAKSATTNISRKKGNYQGSGQSEKTKRTLKPPGIESSPTSPNNTINIGRNPVAPYANMMEASRKRPKFS